MSFWKKYVRDCEEEEEEEYDTPIGWDDKFVLCSNYSEIKYDFDRVADELHADLE